MLAISFFIISPLIMLVFSSMIMYLEKITTGKE